MVDLLYLYDELIPDYLYFADKYAVCFVPRENGVHLIHVRLNHNHIPGSPFRVMVGMGDADPSKVRAYGDGLARGNTGESYTG